MMQLIFQWQELPYFNVSVPGTFSFGNLSAPDTTSTDTKKVAPASKPFVFTPLSTSSTKANSGFNFAMATGVKSDVEQKGVTGAPSGDTAAVTSSNRKEERKSPVGMESKPGGAVGFGFGEAAGMPYRNKIHFKRNSGPPAEPLKLILKEIFFFSF